MAIVQHQQFGSAGPTLEQTEEMIRKENERLAPKPMTDQQWKALFQEAEEYSATHNGRRPTFRMVVNGSTVINLGQLTNGELSAIKRDGHPYGKGQIYI